MEVTALLVLGSLAITGLVSPAEALSGFSNPAVVTVWAVFILSGGLTRTGIGYLIGNQVLRLAGKRESVLVIVIMICAGVLSAFMNNVAVAALMLPVVMDIARRTGSAPSNLLMPLAYGSLLGGLTTQIGTPPNILVSAALMERGLASFGLFDFTPIGAMVMVPGMLFMVFAGRRMLPTRDLVKESQSAQRVDLKRQYHLQKRIFSARVPPGSVLDGMNLLESRLGSALGFNVIAITRRDRSLLAPGPTDELRAGDRLVMEGNPDRLQEINLWRQLLSGNERVVIEAAFAPDIELVEAALPESSPLAGRTFSELRFRQHFEAMVLALKRGERIVRTNLQDLELQTGDTMLLQCPTSQVEKLTASHELSRIQRTSKTEAVQRYGLHASLMRSRIPADSELIGKTLKDLRLGDKLGLRIITILRADGLGRLPDPLEPLAAGEELLIEGRTADLDLLRGYEALDIEKRIQPDMQGLLSKEVGLVEAVLTPRANSIGKTLRQLHFRDKFGLTVLAVGRRGKVLDTNLRDVALDFGDALLLYGPLSRMKVLAREADFVVLTAAAQETPRTEKAWVATAVMAATLLPVLFGWIPIYISAVVGAAGMVLSGCLTMEEAYRNIEWKAVFLIAGMFPLGVALEGTGAAQFIAGTVVDGVGAYGPMAVLAGLLLLTFLATCFIPTAALVVLMAPIVLNTCEQMSLSPQAFMMAIAMAASASFMTPISHPANILVMGPGGYRFGDYLKVGGLLTLVVLVVILLGLPLLWPLQP
jgi:di/tricarboxylate transporter